MSNTCGWDALEWSDEVCSSTVGLGLSLKDYEFFEFLEWWTERETVQPKGLEGSECLTRRRGL